MKEWTSISKDESIPFEVRKKEWLEANKEAVQLLDEKLQGTIENQFVQEANKKLINNFRSQKESYYKEYESIIYYLEKEGKIKPKDFEDFLDWYFGYEKYGRLPLYETLSKKITIQDFAEFHNYKEKRFKAAVSISNKYPKIFNTNCKCRDFKKSIDDLCESCPSKDLIKDSINFEEVLAKEKKEVLTKEQFHKYVEDEVEKSAKEMKEIIAMGECDYDSQFTANRSLVYIIDKEKIKALNRINKYDITNKAIFNDNKDSKIKKYYDIGDFVKDQEDKELKYFNSRVELIEKNGKSLFQKAFDHSLGLTDLMKLQRKLQQAIAIYEHAKQSDKFQFIVYHHLRESLNKKLFEIIEDLKRALNIVETKIAHNEKEIGNDLQEKRSNKINSNYAASKKGNINKKKLTENKVLTFSDAFEVDDWKKYINVFQKTVPALLNDKWEFIGKPKMHKGVVCAWIKSLQRKGVIKLTINRSQLAVILNNEIKNFNVGKDGKTFDNWSNPFEKNFKKQIENLIK